MARRTDGKSDMGAPPKNEPPPWPNWSYGWLCVVSACLYVTLALCFYHITYTFGMNLHSIVA